MPFEIPAGWEWVRLDNICEINLGLTHTPVYVEEGVPFVSAKDISTSLLDLTDTKRISYTEFESFPYGAKPHKGDVLFCRVGTIGHPQIVTTEEPFGIFVSVGFLRLINSAISNEYLKIWMDSPLFVSQVESDVKGATRKNLNTGWLKDFYVPIPPLREQRNIVVEIEKWFSLIDKLEENKSKLLDAIIQTKTKILDLAIHGKLVAQSPNDEPASELLKRIAPHATPCDTSHYENLPQGWAVTSMHNLCRLTEGEKQDGISRLYLDVKYLRGKSDGETMTSGKYVPANSTMILVDGENSGEIFTTPIDGYQGSTFKLLDISDEVYKPFILYVIRSYQKQFREHKVGSAIPHLNKKLFKEISVLIPPYEEQKRIVARIEDIFSSLQAISAEL